MRHHGIIAGITQYGKSNTLRVIFTQALSEGLEFTDAVDRRPARRSVARRRDERLDLDEQRAAPLEGGGDDAPGRRDRVLDQERPGRVGHLAQACLDHLEHADLVRRPEPVLRGPDEAQGPAPLALDRDDGIDEVLQGLRAGDAAVLRHVADQDDRDPLPLRQLHETQRRLAHLAHAAGRAVELVEGRGLDRVDDDRRRTEGAGGCDDPLDVAVALRGGGWGRHSSGSTPHRRRDQGQRPGRG